MILGSMLFVFFKHKTAYEMRISDWSSDVCSSDLRILERRKRHRCQTAGTAGAIPRGARHHDHRVDRIALAQVVLGTRQQIFLDDQDADPGVTEQTYGRTSCRDSVCQYV